MKDILAQGLEAMDITPPDGAVDKLCRYAELLLEQNQVMNLTAITEPEAVARLHFLDSAAILGVERWGAEGLTTERSEKAVGSDAAQSLFAKSAELEPKASTPSRSPTRRPVSTWLAGKSLVDVGTGAGFPGMVLKILEPSLSLTLVDSLGKRLVWLERVCKVLSLDGVRCVHGRAEELALDPEFRDRFDVATSRAVAAFPALCELCLPYVKPGGVFLAMKSVESGAEVEGGANAVKRLGGKALGNWDYPIPGAGVTHRIVGVEKVSATPKGFPRSWGKIKKAAL